MKYLIIGLGHYGATLAMELTAMGHEVVGADGNGLHVDSVKDAWQLRLRSTRRMKWHFPCFR